jgi:hypothetical protein
MGCNIESPVKYTYKYRLGNKKNTGNASFASIFKLLYRVLLLAMVGSNIGKYFILNRCTYFFSIKRRKELIDRRTPNKLIV